MIKREYCVILNHHKDINIIKNKLKNKTYDLYYKNSIVSFFLKKIKIKDLSHKNFNKNYNNFFFSIKGGWYRDSKRKDFLKIKNLFSIGNIMTDYITRDLIVDMRNFYYMKNILNKYKIIYISSLESSSLKRVISLFKNKFLIYKSKNNYCEYFLRDKDTAISADIIKIHRFSKIANILQNFLISFLKKRTLVYPDPFFQDKFKNKNYLHLNSVNILRAYYYKNIKQYNKKFFLEIEKEKKIKQRLVQIAKKFSIKNINPFLKKFTLHIKRKINYNYKIIENCYHLNEELLKRYKPKKIILPGMQEPKNIISIYSAINNNVKTEVRIDGSFINTFNEVPLRPDNKKALIDILNVYSSKEYTFFKKNFFIKNLKLNKKFILRENINKKQINYDIIILDYYWNFNNFSMNSKKDFSYKILDEILNSLKLLNIKKIGIKLKPSNFQVEDVYINFLQTCIIKKYSKYKIDILTGPMKNYLNQSEIFIGGITSAVLEVRDSGSKFIIYQPKETGFDYDYVNKYSIFFKEKDIIRNSTDLSKSLMKIVHIDKSK